MLYLFVHYNIIIDIIRFEYSRIIDFIIGIIKYIIIKSMV